MYLFLELHCGSTTSPVRSFLTCDVAGSQPCACLCSLVVHILLMLAQFPACIVSSTAKITCSSTRPRTCSSFHFG